MVELWGSFWETERQTPQNMQRIESNKRRKS